MIAAILLAAGQSSRMGFPKGLLEWKGMPLLPYQIQQIQRSIIDQLIVVLGDHYDVYYPLITLEGPLDKMVHNEQWKEGKSTSIRKGLAHIHESAQAILFINIDQPISHIIIKKLIGSFLEHGKGIYIPVHQSKRGHPILISSEYKHELMKIKEETQGLKHILQNHSADVYPIEVDEPSILYNFNSLSDYQGRGGNESIHD